MKVTSGGCEKVTSVEVKVTSGGGEGHIRWR